MTPQVVPLRPTTCGEDVAMAKKRPRSHWRIIGKSLVGATHARVGGINQDHLGWLPESGKGDRIMLAVSDGHGSPKSFRSDVGAEYAVKAAKEIAQEVFSDRSFGTMSLS